MKKRTIIIIITAVIALSVTTIIAIARPVAEYTSIESFHINLQACGLSAGETEPFLRVRPSTIEITVGENTSSHTITDSEGYLYVTLNANGRTYYIEYRRALDETSPVIWRVTGAEQIVISDPYIQPNDILAYSYAIDVTAGVRWTAGSDSPYQTIYDTLSHYLFEDDVDNVPFGDMWISGTSIIMVLVVAGLPFLIVFWILRRIGG